LRTPLCYYSRYIPESGDYLLLLEDLSAGRIGDQLAPCTIDEAAAAIIALGDFHAAWWEHPRLESLDWMAPADAPVWMGVAETVRAAWPNFLKNAGDRLPPKALQAGEKLADAIPDLRRSFARQPMTVCHGDFRLDNVFFDVPGARDGIAVIDWQLVMRGRGAYDLAYFLTQSVDADFRRKHQDRLIGEYIRALKDGGVTGYTAADAIGDFRAVALYFFVSPITWLSGDLDVSNERGTALANAFLERSLAALEDLEAWKLLGIS
jgi:Ser/Thr protein kinase RdoA (MazF antagonist)